MPLRLRSTLASASASASDGIGILSGDISGIQRYDNRMPCRYLSTRSDDDFDIPPLDLFSAPMDLFSAPSLSIPPPPKSMIKVRSSNHTNRKTTMYNIRPIVFDNTPTNISLNDDIQIRNENRPSQGKISHTSNGNSRGKLNQAIHNNNHGGHQQPAQYQLNFPSAERKERMEKWQRESVAFIMEKWQISFADNHMPPPAITDTKRRKSLRNLNCHIERFESKLFQLEQQLDNNDVRAQEEQTKIIMNLDYCMSDLFFLKNYGVMHNSSKIMQWDRREWMDERRVAFYAEYGLPPPAPSLVVRQPKDDVDFRPIVLNNTPTNISFDDVIQNRNRQSQGNISHTSNGKSRGKLNQTIHKNNQPRRQSHNNNIGGHQNLDQLNFPSAERKERMETMQRESVESNMEKWQISFADNNHMSPPAITDTKRLKSLRHLNRHIERLESELFQLEQQFGKNDVRTQEERKRLIYQLKFGLCDLFLLKEYGVQVGSTKANRGMNHNVNPREWFEASRRGFYAEYGLPQPAPSMVVRGGGGRDGELRKQTHNNNIGGHQQSDQLDFPSAERKERMEKFQRENLALIMEKWQISKADNMAPPKITDTKRLMWLRRYLRRIERFESKLFQLEQQFGKNDVRTQEERRHLIFQLKLGMSDLFFLKNYGVMNNRSKIKPGDMREWLEERRGAFYAEYGLSPPASSLVEQQHQQPPAVSEQQRPPAVSARSTQSNSNNNNGSIGTVGGSGGSAYGLSPPAPSLVERQKQPPAVSARRTQSSNNNRPIAVGGSNSGAFSSLEFVRNAITTQANGTILGRSGGTSVLSTVVLANDNHDHSSPSSTMLPEGKGDAGTIEEQKRAVAQRNLLNAIQRADAASGATFVPLQVDYRERFHASGKIPMNRRRRDNGGPLSDREVLAARVVDRTVRPWLMTGLASSSSGSTSSGSGSSSLLPENIVVNCEVQSYSGQVSVDRPDGIRTHADPTALAVNSTIAALYQSAHSDPDSNLPIPSEAAACVKLAILRDGTTVFDPTPKESEECKLELLYAGTRDEVLMLEFSVNGGPPRRNGVAEDPGVEESVVADALRSAQEALLPIIEKQEELRDVYVREMEARVLEKDEGLMTDEELARLLGLELPMTSLEVKEGLVIDEISDEVGQMSDEEMARLLGSELSITSHEVKESLVTDEISDEVGQKIIDEASTFVWSKLEHVALKLFGYSEEDGSIVEERAASVHNGVLLSKKVRGRRETLLQAEIARLLREEFVPQDPESASVYCLAVPKGGGRSNECLSALSSHIHECTMKRAMAECAERKLRADGRRGLNVVRTVSATAPIFADSVHGSALFARGETQVISTATLGAPKEGMPIDNPYDEIYDEGAQKSRERGDDDKIPVGSLRFLRNEAEMESDLNSRRVRAGREMTGDSGILSELKRAFLHYDFPDFSTGVVKSRVGASANRRAIGHGNLAEKAVLPALPHLNDFPYTIRMTSEVTSSNGSSSMASACGASLALLDAGVPLVSPVAGVSVGLAPSSEELLLDITGTEDHYGDMDFKICGTYGGITAMQLDVKRPLSVEKIIDALDLAKEGRWAILNAMEDECKNTLPGLQPRSSMKSTAPRVEVISFDPNRKRDLIGPGGTVLRQLEDRFDISLDLSQDGRCLLYGSQSSVSKARTVIMDLVSDVEEGGVYEGTVIEIKDFGAVIELLRNKEGLLHVSEITDSRERHPGGNIGLVKSHLKVGDKIEVLCTKIDHVQGSIKLSRKKLLRMRKNNTNVPVLVNQPDRLSINGDISSDADVQSMEAMNNANPPSFSNEGMNSSIASKMALNDEETEDDQEDWIGDIGEETDDECESDDYDNNSSDTDDDENGYDIEDEDDEENLDEVVSDATRDSSTLETPWIATLESRWMERYNELVAFKNTNGHCNVPKSETPSEYKQLGYWVSKQRTQYKKGKFADNREQLLNNIGFEWSRTNGSFSSSTTLQTAWMATLESRWMDRYDELVAFKNTNGHCNVRSSKKPSEYKQLGDWVSKQRTQYKKGKIAENREQLLNNIGFEWPRRNGSL